MLSPAAMVEAAMVPIAVVVSIKPLDHAIPDATALAVETPIPRELNVLYLRFR